MCNFWTTVFWMRNFNCFCLKYESRIYFRNYFTPMCICGSVSKTHSRAKNWFQYNKNARVLKDAEVVISMRQNHATCSLRCPLFFPYFQLHLKVYGQIFFARGFQCFILIVGKGTDRKCRKELNCKLMIIMQETYIYIQF